jgi:hypothetical protein
MAANTAPIFCRRPNDQWISIINTAANTATDGTGTVATVFTANSVEGEGAFIQTITVKPVSHTGSNNVANVARFFINNGSTNATAANNSFFAELTLQATTGSANAAIQEFTLPVFKMLPNGYKINVCLGTTVGAGLGWYFTAWGGDL